MTSGSDYLARTQPASDDNPLLPREREIKARRGEAHEVPEPVEIKITVGGDSVSDTVATAVQVLQLDSRPAPRLIWFLEDTTPGLAGGRLLDLGIILRLRRNPEGRSDSTVKLRPCRRSQLAKGWREASQSGNTEVRVEHDWAGQLHTSAASCIATLKGRTLKAVLNGAADVGNAFKEPQLAFLKECADIKVHLAGLTILGPIAASKWEKTATAGAVAERWTVGTLDFLEVSGRAASVRDAAIEQAILEKAFADLGIQPANHQESKTRQVITYLMDSATPKRRSC